MGVKKGLLLIPLLLSSFFAFRQLHVFFNEKRLDLQHLHENLHILDDARNWKLLDKKFRRTLQEVASDAENARNFKEDPPKLNSERTKFRALGRDFYVYSAYFDSRHVVKVVAMRETLSRGHDEWIWCQLEGVSVRADPEEVHEKHRSALFVPVILTCDFHQQIEEEQRKDFTRLRLFRNNASVQLNIPRYQQIRPHYLSRCIPIFYGPIDLSFLHSMLAISAKYGVDHFQVYAHPKVMRELETSLNGSGYSVTIKLWQLPVNNFQVWYYGQIIMLQDCLYSLRWRTRLLLVADLDEYLLPENGYLNSIFDSEAASAWNFASVDSGCCFRNRTRSSPNRRLGKYAVIPGRVRSLGVHNVATYENGYASSVNVTPEKAVIVHCSSEC